MFQGFQPTAFQNSFQFQLAQFGGRVLGLLFKNTVKGEFFKDRSLGHFFKNTRIGRIR